MIVSVVFCNCLPNTAKYNVIQIDQYKENDIIGKVYNCGIQKNQPFQGMMDLVQKLNAFLNDMLYPMDSLKQRKFETESQLRGKRFHQYSCSNPIVSELHSGVYATFIVKIQFCNYASWQGEIIWQEENKRQYFRSALEMILLIQESVAKMEFKNEGS